MFPINPVYRRTCTALDPVERNTDCSLIKRETRILPAEIYVLMTDSNDENKQDKTVKRYCEENGIKGHQGK